MTEISFKKIYEHDMDLLIMECFLADRGFAQLFLQKVGLSGDYSVLHAAHSLSDATGESDITLTLQFSGRKVGILIEDKIDAPTMESQSSRYEQRIGNAVSRGDYNRGYAILAAPAAYHAEHACDENAAYAYRIDYEEMLAYFRGRKDAQAAFKAAMIAFAIEEKNRGYQVQEVESVTRFWRELRYLCRREYPMLELMGEDSPKGGRAVWPTFRTEISRVTVVWKSQKGYVDLEVPGYGDRREMLKTLLGNQLTTDMTVVKTGKSASVRLRDTGWCVDFTKPFDEYADTVREVMDAVLRLRKLVSGLAASNLF